MYRLAAKDQAESDMRANTSGTEPREERVKLLDGEEGFQVAPQAHREDLFASFTRSFTSESSASLMDSTVFLETTGSLSFPSR